TLGELEQLVELFLRCVGVEVEAQADLRETDWRILCNAERAPEIELTLRRYVSRPERNVERRRHRLQRDAGARHQRLQQHVTRAQFQPRTASPRMQSCNAQRTAGFH